MFVYFTNIGRRVGQGDILGRSRSKVLGHTCRHDVDDVVDVDGAGHGGAAGHCTHCIERLPPININDREILSLKPIFLNRKRKKNFVEARNMVVTTRRWRGANKASEHRGGTHCPLPHVFSLREQTESLRGQSNTLCALPSVCSK